MKSGCIFNARIVFKSATVWVERPGAAWHGINFRDPSTLPSRVALSESLRTTIGRRARILLPATHHAKTMRVRHRVGSIILRRSALRTWHVWKVKPLTGEGAGATRASQRHAKSVSRMTVGWELFQERTI